MFMAVVVIRTGLEIARLLGPNWRREVEDETAGAPDPSAPQ
jgi:hypothetical protein